jgi:hypothetical protein
MDGGLWRIVLHTTFTCVYCAIYIYTITYHTYFYLRPIEIGVLSRILLFLLVCYIVVYSVQSVILSASPPHTIFFFEFEFPFRAHFQATIAACYTQIN